MKLKGNRIFITGGAGFIGTKLIARLIEDNNIVVYDTLQRNSLKDTDYHNHKNLTITKGNVLDLQSVTDAMSGCNVIIHLAAVAGIDTVIRSPTTTMKVNMLGASNVLDAAMKQKKIDRYFNFSTSEVYGQYAYKLGEGDRTSTGAVGVARWTYATSKLAAEHLALGYYSEFKLPVVSIRPFNIYGPGQVGEGAIHKFIDQALNNKDVTIIGNGDQIRSWCYVDDIVDAVMLCLEKDEAVGEVFNIGNPRGTITILSLAQKIIALSGSKSKLQFLPKNYVDVDVRIPSIEKAEKILGFTPKVDIDEGIARTIEWYRGL